MNQNSVILYVAEEANINELVNDTHQTVLNNKENIAMAVKKNLAYLRVSGVGLEETHGIIGKISETLRLNNINISGILTITSSILLFVEWTEKDKVLNLIKNALKTQIEKEERK
jgi:aspartokinase